MVGKSKRVVGIVRMTCLIYRGRFCLQTESNGFHPVQSCASVSAWYVALSLGKSEGQTQLPLPGGEEMGGQAGIWQGLSSVAIPTTNTISAAGDTVGWGQKIRVAILGLS